KSESTVAGLRYFNVYGPRESHKGKMASMVYQLYRDLKTSGRARLFKGTDGYANGEQRRDFIFVDDIVRVNLALAECPVSREPGGQVSKLHASRNLGAEECRLRRAFFDPGKWNRAVDQGLGSRGGTERQGNLIECETHRGFRASLGRGDPCTQC